MSRRRPTPPRARNGTAPVLTFELERMDIVVVGHVDHGKSTVIGRLMADTGSLPDGKLDQVKAMCAANARPFEYAFLLDALKNEQAQGITIDTARCFFNTANRHYIIHDAPGHVEFLKNMITGASRAQAALLVIDAHEGVRENSKRHGYILSMLGIRQLSVLVNKMDLLDWDQAEFDAIVDEYADLPRPSRRAPDELHPGERARGRQHRRARRAGALVRRPDGARAGRGPSSGSTTTSSVRSACRCRTSTSSPRPATTGASSSGSVETGRVRPGRRDRLPPVGQALDGRDDRGARG